jgi:hypothetical protein
MLIKCNEGGSLWKAEVVPLSSVVVLKRSVAMAGIIEIARAMARKAAREDHLQSMSSRS